MTSSEHKAANPARRLNRRRLIAWGGGLAAAGAAAAGAPFAEAALSGTAEPVDQDRIPPDTLPGGAYDRYVAELAAADKFSGTVLLSHRGRTVLSRSYGMADKEKEVPNNEDVAVNLSSAGKPFGAVALLQLVQQGKLTLTDTVGTHLTGYAKEIADQVTVHHLLTGTSGLDTPAEDLQRIFQSREEMHEYNEQWGRQATLVAPPGTPTHHAGAEISIRTQIIEAVAGMTYWDYVEENIFRRSGMTGTAFYTRPQWLTDEHIAHSYLTIADGSRVDAVRNLDKGSADPNQLGKNPGRSFIDPPGDAGFATATDLVRFAHALGDGTLLDRPYAELLTAPNLPHGGDPGGKAASTSADASFGSYGMPVHITNGQWVWGRAGVNPGSSASWNIYPYTGWVGVILSNYDGIPLAELSQLETKVITA